MRVSYTQGNDSTEDYSQELQRLFAILSPEGESGIFNLTKLAPLRLRTWEPYVSNNNITELFRNICSQTVNGNHRGIL